METASVHNAAKNGDMAIIAQTLNVELLLNDKLENVMHTATRFGQSKVVAYSLQHVPSMALKLSRTKKSVLHCAVKKRDPMVVLQLIVEAPQLIDLANAKGWTPLQHAIARGFTEGVIMMISRNPSSIHQVNGLGKNVLHLAAGSTKSDILSCLLSICPLEMLYKCDIYDSTPLSLAVFCDSIEMVKLLAVKDPLTLDLVDSDGDTPVLIAANGNHDEMFNYLIDMFPHVINHKNAKTHINVLHCVENPNTAQKLLALKPDLANDLTSNGECVLHTAILRGNTDMIRFWVALKPHLLQHRDHENKTPLHLAMALICRQYCGRTILECKPDLIDTSPTGDTTLHVAVKFNDTAIVSSVFANCTLNLHCENQAGDTPFCLAVRNRDCNVIQLFQSFITTDMAVKTHNECLQSCDIDLHALCLQYCDTLNNFLFAPLANIVFEFLGIIVLKKRKV